MLLQSLVPALQMRLSSGVSTLVSVLNTQIGGTELLSMGGALSRHSVILILLYLLKDPVICLLASITFSMCLQVGQRVL